MIQNHKEWGQKRCQQDNSLEASKKDRGVQEAALAWGRSSEMDLD